MEHLGRVFFSAKDIAHYKLVYPGDLVYTKVRLLNFRMELLNKIELEELVLFPHLYCVLDQKHTL